MKSLTTQREEERERNWVNRLVFPGLTVSSLAITSPVAWPSWAIFCLSIKTPLDEVREMLVESDSRGCSLRSVVWMLDRLHHCVESVPHCVPPHLHSRGNCFPVCYHCLIVTPCWFFASSPLSFTLLALSRWEINLTALPRLLCLSANISILGDFNNRTSQAWGWTAKTTTLVD